jgi:hypothetical protein
MSQNELALQLYSAGLFNPQVADQSLLCLDMMDFPRKESIIQKVAQNGTLLQQLLMTQQQLLQMAKIIDQTQGTNMAEQIAAGIVGGAPASASMAGGAEVTKKVEETEALGGKEGGEEATNTKKARQRVAESTDPT